jgi:lysozyme
MRDWFERFRPDYALQMPDEPAFAEFLRGLGVKVIGRVYKEDQNWNNPESFANELFNSIMSKAMLRSVWAWMGGNEPNGDKIRESAIMDLILLERLRAEGILYIPGSYSVGIPSGSDGDPFSDWDMPEMIELYRIAQYVGVHEYCAPRMESEFIHNPGMNPAAGGYYTMRHKFAMARLATHLSPHEMPKVLILESGIDSGIGPPWPVNAQGGWKNFTDLFDYMEQVEWMHELMDAEALIIFIMGTYYNEGAKWPTYDVWHPPKAREAFGSLILKLKGEDPSPSPSPSEPPPSPSPSVSPSPPPVNPWVGGIDVSQHQGYIDWLTVSKSETVERVMIRASSGRRSDRRYHQNWLAAGRLGIRRGAYHYLYPGDEWQQAWLFLNIIQPSEEPYVLDVEQSGLTETNVLAFIGAWESMTDEPLAIYTSPGLWHELVGHDAVWAKHHTLWVAHWGVDEPTLPDPWEDWYIWQYTSEGRIPGIQGNVDLDWFKKGE